MARSRVAHASIVVSGLAAALLAAGPLLAQLDAMAPLAAFSLFLAAIPLALLALILGVTGLLATRGAQRGGRGRALLSCAFGGGVIGVLVVVLLANGDLPRINDITTDPADPPDFHAIARLPPNRSRDLSYPPDFAEQQRAAYPDVKPIELDVPPPTALARAETAARALGWTIVAKGDGHIEATDRSSTFGFVDDIVVRVQPTSRGSRVDVRSKSRDGRGDLGANAARIRAFAAQLAK